MEKNNVAYKCNGKDVAAFFDFNDMMETVISILKDAREEMCSNEREKELVMEQYSDELIEELAFEDCCQTNSDMKKYLNKKDHKIIGNFGNIEDDYIKHITGTYWISEYDGSKGDWHEIFPSFVKRMNEMDDSEQSVEDRKWVVEWYFITFGTFGLKYNFQDGIAEYLYEVTNEDVAV